MLRCHGRDGKENVVRRWRPGSTAFSKLLRSQILLPGTEAIDLVSAMTNLVVQAVRKLSLPCWVPTRNFARWTHHAENTAEVQDALLPHLGLQTNMVILAVTRDGAVSSLHHAETTEWLRTLTKESRLLRWIASIIREALARSWTFASGRQTIQDRVLQSFESDALTTTSTHLSLHFDGFMVNRDLQPTLSTEEFLRRMVQPLLHDTGVKVPDVHKNFTDLLSMNTPRARPDDVPEGVGSNLSTRAWGTTLGFTTACWDACWMPFSSARSSDDLWSMRQ